MGTAAVVALAGCEPGPVVPRWLRRLFSRKLSVSAMPPCIVRPEQTEGPYFVDERLNRSDIRSDPSDGSVKEGVPLQLALRVHEIRGKGCLPRAGALLPHGAGPNQKPRGRDFPGRRRGTDAPAHPAVARLRGHVRHRAAADLIRCLAA